MTVKNISRIFSRQWSALAVLTIVLLGLLFSLLRGSTQAQSIMMIAVFLFFAWATVATLRSAKDIQNLKVRRSWRYLGIGLMLWTVAMAAEALGLLFLSSPMSTPSPIDLLRIAGSLAILTSLSLFPAFPDRGFGRMRVVLDILLLMLGMGTLFWLIFMRSVLVIGIVNPIPAFWAQVHAGLSFILLPLAARIILLKDEARERSAFLAIMLAVVLFFIAELVRGYQVLEEAAFVSGIVSAGRMLGGLVIVFASKYILDEWNPIWKMGPASPRSRRIEALLPIALAYAVVGFLLVDWWISGVVDWFSIRAAILMVVLLIARQGVLIGQSELRLYAALVNATTDMAIICDEKGAVRLMNPALRKAIQIPIDDESILQLHEIVLSGIPVDALLSLASVSGWSGEVVLIRRDGFTFPASLSLMPIRDERRGELLFVSTGYDLTTIKLRENELRTALENLEDAQTSLRSLNTDLEGKVDLRTRELKETVANLARLNEDLQALDVLKTEFVALVSHELRAPLTNIRTGLDLVLNDREGINERTRESLDLIKEESTRLASFVETILDLSALDSGKFPIETRPLSLVDIVNEVGQKFSADNLNQRIQVEIPSDLPILHVDHQAISSVLFHILDNALKYASEGDVLLEAVLDGDQILIEISDAGPGIPEDLRERVFEMFYRLDTRDAREIYGRGLGLNLSKRYLEVMGGSIELSESKPGGTKVIIALPLAKVRVP
ncbi:MAG: hypothetical protein IIC78_02630 [Chloroflexi bacterium]|nr:hypothetical protein [Chloroflexota bacterium]